MIPIGVCRIGRKRPWPNIKKIHANIVIPAGNWKIAKTASVLGAALAGQRRFEEAEPLLVESYPIIKDDRGPHHRRTQQALERIVALYDAWNRPQERARYEMLLADANGRVR